MYYTRRTVPHRKGILQALIVLIALPLPGCQTARMPLPDALVTAERLPVSGRQGLQIEQRLRFGSYAAHPITRSWTRGRDRGATLAAQQFERRQTYQFTLQDGDVAHWFVSCHASARSIRIDLAVVEAHPADESALYCNLQSTTDRLAAWEMELQERRGRPLAGMLAMGDTRFDIDGTDRLERALPMGATTGYEIHAAGDVVGAVEVINRGAVWLSPDLEPERRRLLAAAAAALLLLEDLYETIRD
jgi:hypothetical protein